MQTIYIEKMKIGINFLTQCKKENDLNNDDKLQLGINKKNTNFQTLKQISRNLI